MNYRGESLFMLFMYVVYCVVLHFNTPLEKWSQTLPVPCKRVEPQEESGLVSYKTLEEERKRSSYGCSPDNVPENLEQGFDQNLSGPALNQMHNAQAPPPSQKEYYRPREHDPATAYDPLVKPVGESF